MPEDQRLTNAGEQSRQDYLASIEADRLRSAAENIVNVKGAVQEPIDAEHTVFPFDKEEPHMQAMAAAPAVPITAVVGGFAEVAQKSTLLASIGGAMTQVGLPIIATVLIGGGIGLGVVSVMNNIAVQNQVNHYATEASDSGQTGSAAGFIPSTNPKEPVKVEIADLFISADTTKVDVNSKGDIGSPANIKQLAWYDQSSSPADSTGNALIVGHVGTPTYAGALAQLYKVQNGADVKVTMGDGKIVLYRVTKSENVAADKIDMSDYLTKSNQTDKNLVLITCSGDYNSTTYSYSDRLIVTAAAVSN